MRRILAFALLSLWIALTLGCKASSPGDAETRLAAEAKKITIGGKDWVNPTPDTPEVVNTGKEHFQHHCQICHGLDGHNTGVPFAAKMSPPILDLGDKEVKSYEDGQLKWIIENGIRFSGMPGWKDTLEDQEMWSIVRFLRNLPEKGSQGVPDVFKESEREHHEMSHSTTQGRTKGGQWLVMVRGTATYNRTSGIQPNTLGQETNELMAGVAQLLPQTFLQEPLDWETSRQTLG